jgi:glycosyltransferase involved in cell wall biosynthesis
MADRPALTIVIPAHDASATIGATLRSVVAAPLPGGREILVVDDGSPDGGALAGVVRGYEGVTLLRQPENRGVAAARNLGIGASRGDVVMILDADDTLVPGWPAVFEEVLAEWPAGAGVCFSACRNAAGRSTVREPGYRGPITFDDLLHERHGGEYLPMFRGDYIRPRGYADFHMRKECGIVSHLSFAREGPFWATPRVLRIYDDRRTGSMSNAWAEPDRARETARCYEALFERFGALYRERAPRAYRRARLRHAVHLRLAGERAAWRAWRAAASWACPMESAGALLMLGLGRSFTRRAVACGKRLGLIKRYG